MATTSAITEGNALMVFYKAASTTGSGQTIAFATSNSLSVTTETDEVMTKDTGLSPYTTTKYNTWEVTCDNLYTEDFGSLYALQRDMQPVELKFGTPANYSTNRTSGVSGSTNWTVPSTGNYFSGTAVITSLELNADSGDNATFTVTFKGQSPLAYN